MAGLRHFAHVPFSYAADNPIGSTIEGLSFSGLLTEIGHIPSARPRDFSREVPGVDKENTTRRLPVETRLAAPIRRRIGATSRLAKSSPIQAAVAGRARRRPSKGTISCNSCCRLAARSNLTTERSDLLQHTKLSPDRVGYDDTYLYVMRDTGRIPVGFENIATARSVSPLAARCGG